MVFYASRLGTAILGSFKLGVFDETNANAVTGRDALFTIHGLTATLTKNTETTDLDGGLTSNSTSDTAITIVVNNNNEQVRRLTGRGVSLEGSLIIYAKNEYSGVKVEVGDTITINSVAYSVERLIGNRRFSGGIMHKAYLIRRVVS